MDPVARRIAELDPLDRDLLSVLAFVVEPIARSRWIELATRHGIRPPGTRAFDAKTFAPHCERLAATGLVVIDAHRPNTPEYGLRGNVAMAALVLAHEERRFAGLLAPRLMRRDTWRDARESAVDLRVAAVLQDNKLASRALESMYAGPDIGSYILAAFGTEPRAAWLELLPHAHLRESYLRTIIAMMSAGLGQLSEIVIEQASVLEHREIRLEVARVLALRGESARAAAIAGLPKWGAEGIAVLDAFVAGDWSRAHATGQHALAAMKGRKKPALPDIEGACHMLATIVAAVDDPACAVQLEAQLDAARDARRLDLSVVLCISNIHEVLVGGIGRVTAVCKPADRSGHWLVALVHALHDLWLRPKSGGFYGGKTPAEVDAIARDVAVHWAARATAGGYADLAREFAAIVAAYDGASAAGRLAGAFRRRTPWEAALASLELLGVPTEDDASAEAPRRELVWEIDVYPQRVSITARIRTGTRAKKGQTVSLWRLADGKHDDLLSDADRRVLAGFPRGDELRFGGGGTSLPHRALLGLIGHPRVVDPHGLPIAVERGEPKIHTRTGPGGTKIELVPAALRDDAIAVQQPSPDRVIVYERTTHLDRLADVLARMDTLEIPDEGKDRLVRALTRVSATAGVAVEGDVEIGAAVVIADTAPILQLGWTGTVLSVRAAVAPMGPRGPHVRPGAGARELIGEIKGEGLHRCTRDLATERARIDAVLDACPTLVGFADGDLHWSVGDLADALAIMLELDALGDAVTLAWQQGQKLDVPKPVDLKHLQLRVGAAKNWLELEVELAVDEHAVLQYRELLKGREGGRFVALPRGRFLVLSDRLRRHLDQLETLGAADGKGMRVATALLPVVEQLAADLGEGASFDATTLARLEKLREIATLVPRMPSGFATTLRAYQRDGFTWMVRLAEAGLGACLADDMGLGKTVQALALLTHRAKLGAQLVVCPTSVVMNWLAETKRFAPSLRVTVLNTADDRSAALAGLGPRDVLVCSYALLGTEIESLARQTFATAVFDEAHALKNPRTQRAAASRRIDAGFRLALTGTPLENHLGEIWSLFATIVPGLLGTQTQFDDRFTNPIASGNRERATQLRTILRPFMLRRLKASVLDELPPRTEITLKIAPYAEQRAFYEAVRRSAVEHMAAIEPKKKRLAVLAEITKLRQAAIDPRVLDAEAGPKGAKLDVLFERLSELRAEGHRALVFTQFLGSLAAVRERLLAEKIEFFELDGSTPAAVRARRIDAFQAGEGDVFLLSLRAGGVGVNLTGADYVFHLDPWWNPAVEDQATDRTHRIGQSRPVTVYRLVTEGTIEEKILALHESKRQLADDLLAGMERSEGLDFEQLVALLRE